MSTRILFLLTGSISRIWHNTFFEQCHFFHQFRLSSLDSYTKIYKIILSSPLFLPNILFYFRITKEKEIIFICIDS
jgi:hypothetical protein